MNKEQLQNKTNRKKNIMRKNDRKREKERRAENPGVVYLVYQC